ncbi:amidohydrolase family protein [Sphingomonas sp. MS122]|uniref:amidohydrolase family protein n=1 Tax=Sphingomonas sp. MS122 TaxID=3412683 RepID=UPI003C2CB6B7
MRIDAHQHYWRIGRNGHEWPTPDLSAIHRDFLPADLAPELAPLGIARTIAVQSQPADADTDWLLDLAANEPSVAAVVGWCDVRARDAPARIAALAARPKLRGLRPMLQDLPPGWILDPAAAPALAAMAEAGLAFDALIRPVHLPDIAALADTWPSLVIIVDHGAKPPIAAGRLEPWATQIRDLATRANVSCKLSGLTTEAAAGWTPDDLAPYVRHLLACFGADRLIWGSDWPVLRLAGDYAQWFEIAGQLLPGIVQQDRDAIFGGNAARLYRLDAAYHD